MFTGKWHEKWNEVYRVMAIAKDKHSIDVSDMLKPGVYILSLGSRVVYVGRAKCILAAIADHRTAVGSRTPLPHWFPVQAVRFDSIDIIPMPYEQAFSLVQAMIEFHQPTHNIHRQPAPPPTRSTQSPPQSDSPVITRRI